VNRNRCVAVVVTVDDLYTSFLSLSVGKNRRAKHGVWRPVSVVTTAGRHVLLLLLPLPLPLLLSPPSLLLLLMMIPETMGGLSYPL